MTIDPTFIIAVAVGCILVSMLVPRKRRRK